MNKQEQFVEKALKELEETQILSCDCVIGFDFYEEELHDWLEDLLSRHAEIVLEQDRRKLRSQKGWLREQVQSGKIKKWADMGDDKFLIELSTYNHQIR